MADDKTLTVERSTDDLKRAYSAKRKLIEREKEDFLFALGKQWSDEDADTLKKAGFKPFTDNRIAPNLYLLTGLERQNRTDFKAFPEGEEDSLKAEITTVLFKNSIKVSDFQFKSSDQFKDGITCGESHLELYLDNTFNILNGKPCWKKVDGNCIFPEPGTREYDFSDARYVYKITYGISKDDLISLFPDKSGLIEKSGPRKLEISAIVSDERHRQPKDYGTKGVDGGERKEDACDLIERYYKKWVEKVFVGDRQTGAIKESESKEKADEFVTKYKDAVAQEEMMHQQAMGQFQVEAAQRQAMGGMMMEPETGVMAPVPPPVQPEPPTPKDPERFILIKRRVPEIWCFAHVPGIPEPLADEAAWFYPKWKAYPFVPFFARFSTAPIDGEERHLLIQGIVNGVKGAQEKHNKSEMLILRHLNTATNSGWLTEEDSWMDRTKAEQFGTAPGVNLEYKKGSQKPERIFPMPLSQGHAQISAESAEAIKAQLGINADLLATQDGGSQSGRAIALRQRQGLLMVQELFDNLSRTRAIAGKFLLSQLGEIYDTETAKKILGDAFLKKNFPPLMLMNPQTGQQEPMPDATGQAMVYDKEMAELTIAEVLSGDLGLYDVTVGESVSSETTRMANAEIVKEIAQAFPGLVPPDVLVEVSQLPPEIKNRVAGAMKAQAEMQAQAQAAMAVPPGGAPAGMEKMAV